MSTQLHNYLTVITGVQKGVMFEPTVETNLPSNND